MTDEQFINLLSMQMVQVKISMQILASLLDKEQFKEWDESFEKIEKKFDAIVKAYEGKKDNG